MLRGKPEGVSDSLFDVPGGNDRPGTAVPSSAPLAVRMRPGTIDEVVGQDHLLRPGSPLRRLVEGSGAASVILYGPPGTGKTTLASLISQATGRRFEALSALSAGVKEVRAVIDNARRAAAYGEQTVLFIDEVHRFSKTQQDALLAAVEAEPPPLMPPLTPVDRSGRPAAAGSTAARSAHTLAARSGRASSRAATNMSPATPPTASRCTCRVLSVMGSGFRHGIARRPQAAAGRHPLPMGPSTHAAACTGTT